MDGSLRYHRALERDTRPARPRRGRVRSLLRRALLLGSVVLVAGCAVSKALESAPGIDLSPVKAGATRQEVEAVVGEPLREWTTRTGVRYRLYRYDAGIEPSAGGAGLVVFMDVITLGLFEVIEAASPAGWNIRGEKKQPLLAVSYDTQEIVIGVFKDVGELDDFPEDGQVAARPVRGVNASER